jgi:hypothetical protein
MNTKPSEDQPEQGPESPAADRALLLISKMCTEDLDAQRGEELCGQIEYDSLTPEVVKAVETILYATGNDFPQQ